MWAFNVMSVSGVMKFLMNAGVLLVHGIARVLVWAVDGCFDI